MNKEIKKQKLRRFAVYLLIITMFWAIPYSAIAAGKLKLSGRAFEIGTVTEGDTILKRVSLENTGNKKIEVKNISTS